MDCHTHLLPPKRSKKLIEWTRTFIPDHPISPERNVEELISDLKKAGARRWVNLVYPIWDNESGGLNRWAAELSERHPQIAPFGGVHLNDPDPMEIAQEAIEGLGMRGLKFHPMVQRFSPGEEKLSPVFDYLDEKRKAVYIHTGYDEWYGWRLPPEHIEAIAGGHPNLAVALPHLGFPRLEWAFGLAEKYSNIWLDLTNVFGSLAWMANTTADKELLDRLNELLAQRIPPLAKRTMFGTDHPAGMGDIEQIFKDLKAFDLSDGLREQILLKSAADFLDRCGGRE